MSSWVRRPRVPFSLLLALALLIAVVFLQPSFAKPANIPGELSVLAPFAILAMASTPAVLSGGGGIDLTVGPLSTVVNCIFVTWLIPHGWGGAESVVVLLAIGAAVGFINGLLVAVLRYQPVVATLCGFFILAGLAQKIAPNPVPLPHNWTVHLAGNVGPVPGGLIMIACPLVVWALLGRTSYLRGLYAVGGDDASAYSAGLNVVKIRVLAYALGGLFAAIGGIALTALIQTSSAATSSQYALIAVAGVALGGTSFAGGARWHVPIVARRVLHLHDPAAAVCGERVGDIPAARLRRCTHRRSAHEYAPPSRSRPQEGRHVSTTGVTVDNRSAGGSPPGPRGAARSAARRVAGWQSRFPALQVLALIAVVTYGLVTIPGFGSSPSVKSMAVLAALLGLAALPQTLVVLLGGIDFSIPAFIAVGGILTAALAGGRGWPIGEVLLLIVVACGACGAVSGFLCHRFTANPLIVTLGMYAVVEGAILVSTNGDVTDPPPDSLIRWTAVNGKTFGIGLPPVVVLWIVVALVVGLALSRTPPGRRLYATGTNLRAARLALMRTEVIWTVIFMLSAIIAGLTGVLVSSYASGATSGMGDVYLFQGLTAVIIGGTAIGYARGDYWRTVLGSLILTAVTTVLIGKGFDSTDTQILFGFVILIVVGAYGRQQRVQDRV